MEGRHPPVVPASRRLVRARERGAHHHGIGATRDRLGDVAAGTHPAVSDDVHVHTGLVEVADAVACGTPIPSTPRLVHACPGPTPTRIPTAPVRMRWSAVE